MRLLNLSMSQLLWVFIATKLIIKLKANRLFLRWLASYGLKCYRVPTDGELRKLQYSNKNESKKNQQKRPKSPTRTDEIKIRCSDLVKLELATNDVNSSILNLLPFGDDLEWRVDFAFMALISFLLTQTLFYFSPRSNEYNFSLVWIFLVILQCFTTLVQISAIYFQNKAAVGEQSMIMVAAVFFLLSSMFVLTVGDTHLELKIDESIQLLSHMTNKHALLEPDQIDTLGPLATLCVKLVMALFCSIAGAILTFPGFRFGQMHESIIADVTTSKFQKIICNINLVSPFVVICLWIPNISRNLLRKQELVSIDDDRFELIRSCTMIVSSVLRFILVRRYIKAFLMSAVEYRLAQIRRKCGFTSNKAIQQIITNLNTFTNAAIIQYVLPTILCLFTSIMFASFTHYSSHHAQNDATEKITSLRYLFGSDQPAMIESAEELISSIRGVFSSDLVKNSLGFAAWWTHFAWLCTTTAGVAYYKYFEY